MYRRANDCSVSCMQLPLCRLGCSPSSSTFSASRAGLLVFITRVSVYVATSHCCQFSSSSWFRSVGVGAVRKGLEG
jgi:hypothetical protein